MCPFIRCSRAAFCGMPHNLDFTTFANVGFLPNTGRKNPKGSPDYAGRASKTVKYGERE